MAPTNTASVSASSSTTTSGHDKQPHVSANFAQKKSAADHGPVEYDHEIYLQLMAGGTRSEKTPNQVYREERANHLRTRSLDPAISDPQGDPSSVDFECTERSQGTSSRG